ncbi:hypothetical protein BZA70DRAFT_85751 [Myxozyma melibiosi]|uniref:Shugoshin C-terminal domain-containing protein n=1 Tax=Myxozyma melibiosi TaxID=54550 RepID=A0ABR1F0A8_9ASCO
MAEDTDMTMQSFTSTHAPPKITYSKKNAAIADRRQQQSQRLTRAASAGDGSIYRDQSNKHRNESNKHGNESNKRLRKTEADAKEQNKRLKMAVEADASPSPSPSAQSESTPSSPSFNENPLPRRRLFAEPKKELKTALKEHVNETWTGDGSRSPKKAKAKTVRILSQGKEGSSEHSLSAIGLSPPRATSTPPREIIKKQSKKIGEGLFAKSDSVFRTTIPRLAPAGPARRAKMVVHRDEDDIIVNAPLMSLGRSETTTKSAATATTTTTTTTNRGTRGLSSVVQTRLRTGKRARRGGDNVE